MPNNNKSSNGMRKKLRKRFSRSFRSRRAKSEHDVADDLSSLVTTSTGNASLKHGLPLVIEAHATPDENDDRGLLPDVLPGISSPQPENMSLVRLPSDFTYVSKTSLSSGGSGGHRRHRRRRDWGHLDHRAASAAFPSNAPATVNTQEYNVDHSCSTPLERLARDIGSELRRWRVHGGVDRHVSLDWRSEDPEDPGSLGNNQILENTRNNGNTQSPENIQNIQNIDTSDEGVRNAVPRDAVNLPGASAKTAATPMSTENNDPKQQSGSSSHHPFMYEGARCIRKKGILFQTAGFSMTGSPPSGTSVSSVSGYNRRRYNIPLVLTLWDAPRIPIPQNGQHRQENKAVSEVDSDWNASDQFLHSEHSYVDEAEWKLFRRQISTASTVDHNIPIPHSLHPDPSPSAFALLGDHGILSQCGTHRPFQSWEKSGTATYSGNLDGVNVGKNQCLHPMETGLGHDLSSLFNIGQHITLSLDVEALDPPAQHTHHLRDLHSLTSDIRGCIQHHLQQAYETLRRSELQRKQQKRREWRQKQIERRQRQTSEIGGASGNMSSMEELHDSHTFEYDEDYEDDDDSNDSNDIRDVEAEVTASLSSILQSALNLAASENDCRIPVFGIWGGYHGGERTKPPKYTEHHNDLFNHVEPDDNRNASPSWVPSISSKNIEMKNTNDALLLSSPLLSGTCQAPSFHSTHRLYSITNQLLPAHLSTLHGLGCVLLSQCPENDGTVMVSTAKHCYHWKQIRTSDQKQDWRNVGDQQPSSTVKSYRELCRQKALLLLERASSPWSFGTTVPMWGPTEGNPLSSISASISWGVLPTISIHSYTPPPPSLLTLPLKIRSSNFVPTHAELREMESALQGAVFNPLGIGVGVMGESVDLGPREPIFFVSVSFDADAACATLSANTRCVLAALLRCGSLGMDALPGHLTKKDVLSKLGQIGEIDKMEGASESALRKAMDLAEVGPVTARLVNAMGWGDVKASPSYVDLDRGIAEALQRVGAGGLYPTPPIEAFCIDDTNPNESIPSIIHHSTTKASPPGRLLSILFAHIARLRTPPSMMRLWLSFVEELRARWDLNESLPNLGFVPGLDNDKEYGSSHLLSHWGLQKADHRVLGHRAHHAAFVNSSEPDPDRDHCIINQKLQVFNICIECKMSTEALHEKKSQQTSHETEMRSEATIDGDHSESITFVEDVREDTLESLNLTSRKSIGVHINSSWDCDSFVSPPNKRVCLQQSSKRNLSCMDEFFDPEEEEPYDPRYNDAKSYDSSGTFPIPMTPFSPRHNRFGARCPVPGGLTLIETGDQLYAPYLQRTMPMTDEEEEKRKKLLVGNIDGDDLRRVPIQSRIAISQRLQKPKLLSDMSAFKAANPGAVFEDFVKWYGNPENPLDEEVNGETARRAFEHRLKLPKEEGEILALESASEAISILMSLRTFWSDTWDEAEPCPASEQEPLFDPYSTVEMVLHSFETIHPALLMNQALAVNFANANFVLEAAANPVMRARSVKRIMLRLQRAISDALEMLTKDASESSLSPSRNETTDNPLVYASTLTINRCEYACNAIGEAEILISRALSLLQKFSGEYDLIDELLQCRDGDFVFVKYPNERNAVLSSIKREQMMDLDSSYEASTFPEASMREYVIRNTDVSHPCQLSARLVTIPEDNFSSSYRGSLLLALTKCSRD